MLKMGSTVNTNTGLDGSALGYMDLEANASRAGLPLSFKFVVPQQTAITGPFLSYMMRIENLDKNNGVCFSSLYGVGGQSLWDMNTQMNAYTMSQLTNYFSEIRRLQLSKNQSPLVVIYINSGLNDQNETSTPSHGWRASTDASSATAYLDNLEALAKRISDVWQTNGWDERELFFWINPSHPTATPDASKLKLYRKAAFSFAGQRSRVSVVDLENLTSEAELTANDWYREPTDHYHLKISGYEALSQRVIALIK
jgi:lysophospholipase L1-like esterase